ALPSVPARCPPCTWPKPVATYGFDDDVVLAPCPVASAFENGCGVVVAQCVDPAPWFADGAPCARRPVHASGVSGFEWAVATPSPSASTSIMAVIAAAIRVLFRMVTPSVALVTLLSRPAASHGN